jgi:hypothetical protein
VTRKLEEYQAALRASVDDEDVQLRLEIDSRGAREWKVLLVQKYLLTGTKVQILTQKAAQHSNETDLLIHHTLRHALKGAAIYVSAATNG